MENGQNARRDFSLGELRALYKSYGFSRYKMSKFEEYDLYVRNKSFLISDNIITFTDTDGKLMALKPDVTLSIVKNNRGEEQKVYYDESVYRISNHTYKEIRQIGLERIGDIDTYAIYETLVLAIKSLELISDDFVLDISHMGIVSAIMEEVGVPESARGDIIECIGEKNPHGIRAICMANGVGDEGIEILCKLATTYGKPLEVFEWVRDTVKSESGRESAIQLLSLILLLEKDSDRVRVDFSVVNDMSYYNGFVFKGFVNGVPSGVLSGGQYDKLMDKMGKKAGAIGFAVYPDQLEELMTAKTEYDVSTVVLYDRNADLFVLKDTVSRLTEDGESVLALKELPEKLRYKKLIKIMGEEVTTLEDNA